MDQNPKKASRPAKSPEAREKQMVVLAVNLAEKQLMDGTASSAVITHYLKLASSREKIEQDMMLNQSKLVAAKAEQIAYGKETESTNQSVLEALKGYRSSTDDEEL